VSRVEPYGVHKTVLEEKTYTNSRTSDKGQTLLQTYASPST